MHVSGPTDEEQAGEDLLDECTDLRERQAWSVAGSATFGLEKRVGHGADHHVVLPSGIRPTLEVIEPEFGFEVLVMLFDRPALMGQADELRQRGRRGQRDEVMFAAPSRAQAAFAQEPNLWASRRWRQSVAGVTRRAAKSASQGGIGAVAPRHPSPRARRQRVAERADADRLLIGPALAAIARRPLRGSA